MPDPVDEVLAQLAEFRNRPKDFVRWAFPWGESGSELENARGPEKWQDRVLGYLQERLEDYDYMPVRVAVASGHGIGKSACLSWINLWAFSSLPDTRGYITANTESQLKTKTWVEMSKWKRLFLAGDLFRLTATALFPEEVASTKEWRIDILPWSEKNPSAFAGLHNVGKRSIVTFDEAAEIPQIIWETSSGAETDVDTQIIRFAFGNPTDPDNYFRECFDGGKHAKYWYNFRVDSREVSISNKALLNSWIDSYGIESDYVKVRILGEFPAQSGDTFITRASAEAASNRPPPPENNAGVVLGIDVGRKNDPTVIYPRQGLDAQSRPPIVVHNSDTQQILSRIRLAMQRYDPETVFIDTGYIGMAIYDMLINLNQRRPLIIGVDFGAGPDGTNEQAADAKYLNKRSEIWGAMRAWLQRGSIVSKVEGLPNSLVKELSSPHYELSLDTRIQLESKKLLKNRLKGESCNVADALACTFALPDYSVTSRPVVSEFAGAEGARHTFKEPAPDFEYDPFAPDRIYGASGSPSLFG